MAKAFLILCACLVAVLLEVSASPVPDGQALYGDKFQGDIYLTEEQRKLFYGEEEAEGNTGTLHIPWRWPMNLNRQVVVPYRIEARHGYTSAEVTFLLNGMRRIEAGTCIRFVVRTNQADFIDFRNGVGCGSWLGRIGGAQEVTMERPGCFARGIAEHEYMHALGFAHMHQASNRDSHIAINWNNMIPEFQREFQIVNPSQFSNFNTPYDLRSVMHYHRTAFSRNGQDTIVPHDRAFIDVIGLGMTVTNGDLTRLNRMYQC